MHICFASPHEWLIAEETLDLAKHRVTKLNVDAANLVERINEKKPDIIFFNGFDQGESFLEILKNLSELLPSATLIPVIKSPEPAFLLRAMRFGVREVLSNDTAGEVGQALARVGALTAPTRKSDDAKQMARKVGFMSAKGGDGGSFLSANLASALVSGEAARVLLLDLAIPFGDVEMYLSGDSPANDLSDITNEIDRLDHALLTSMAHRFSDTLDFVPSPRSFEKIINLQPEQIEKMFDIAVTNYDFLIADIGTGFDPITLRTIEKLDQLFLVVTQSIPSIRRAGQIIRLLESIGFTMAKVSLIINKFSPKEPIGQAEVEAALKKTAGRKFPYDAEGVRESIIKGVPYVSLFPKSDLTKAVAELAEDWLGKPREEKSVWRRFGIK